MKKEEGLEIYDIVQIAPEVPFFGGCFMTVTEVKEWGAQGFVQCFAESREAPTPGPQAYFRPTWEKMEKTGGKAVWAPGEEEDEETPPS